MNVHIIKFHHFSINRINKSILYWEIGLKEDVVVVSGGGYKLILYIIYVKMEDWKCPVCGKKPIEPVNLRCDHHPCFECASSILDVEDEAAPL